jgi:hypothetical protein
MLSTGIEDEYTGGTEPMRGGIKPRSNRRVRLADDEWKFYVDQIILRETFDVLTSPKWKGRWPGLSPFPKITVVERDKIRNMMGKTG